MSPDTFFSLWGAWGVVVALLVWQNTKLSADLQKERDGRTKEREQWQAEFKTEHEARLAEAKANTQAMLDLNNEANGLVKSLASIAEALTGKTLPTSVDSTTTTR